MNFYIIESHALAVGWSPKCACTAVCDWLVRGVIKPETPVKAGARDYLRDNGFLRTQEEAVSLILNDGFKPVLFVRNPATRLASGFIDKFVCRRGEPLIYPINYEKLVINTITACYEASQYSGDYKGLSFVDLLDYIDFSMSAGHPLDHHWAPQATGLSEPLKSHLLAGNCFVVKQESFQHDLKNVNFALGLTYVPPQINTTRLPKQWTALPENSDYSTVANKIIVEKKAKIKKRNILTRATRSSIARIYRDDFKLFSYPLSLTGHS